MSKILIVEDESKIARFLQLELNHEGYEVEIAFDGYMGLNMALKEDVDLVLLDLMLPGLSGIEVCRRIRIESQVPVIMLTAKGDVSDKVTGLDMGADDYVTKPFAIEEILARIRVRLKGDTTSKNELKYGLLTINCDSYDVTYDGESISLTKKEFMLLKYLLENKDVAMSREKILLEVWGYDFIGDTNVVDVYVSYLRSKIEQKYDTKIISTLRGVGYIIKEIKNEKK